MHTWPEWFIWLVMGVMVFWWFVVMILVLLKDQFRLDKDMTCKSCGQKIDRGGFHEQN